MGFDIDEAIDEQNWKKESSVSLRFTSENDLDEIFNLIQTVGKEMECKDNELFGFLLLGVDYRILGLGQAIIPHFERGGVDDLDVALIFAVYYFAVRSVFKE